MKLKTPYSRDYDITKVNVCSYRNNNNLAIQLMCNEDGHDEPYGTLTVNFDLTLPPFMGYVDVNNIPYIKNFIKENGLGEEVPGYKYQSGFVSYPLYQFNKEKLRELDPNGFEEYMKNQEYDEILEDDLEECEEDEDYDL